MAAVAENQAKRWTYDDYCQLEGEHRHEVINGALLMAPAPDTAHQDWFRELFHVVDRHVRAGKLGTIFFAPLDVILDSENVVQPDLIFISKERAAIIQPRGVCGAPDLVVEILSPSTIRRDRYDKKELYARFGVKEYWIADPANRTLEILTLRAGGYQLHALAEERGKLTSLVLAQLEFDLAESLF